MLLPAAVGLSLAEPLVFCAPVQAPLAVHEVASLEDQVSVALWPSVMVVGATVIVTVGGGDDAPAGGGNFVRNTSCSPELKVVINAPDVVGKSVESVYPAT